MRFNFPSGTLVTFWTIFLKSKTLLLKNAIKIQDYQPAIKKKKNLIFNLIRSIVGLVIVNY